MGYIANDAVIVTFGAYMTRGGTLLPMPDVEAFKASMPEELGERVVGPFPSAINDDLTYFWVPDGSKEGWDMSNLGDEWRQKFVGLFSAKHEDGSSPFTVVCIRYGEDHGSWYGTTITYTTDTMSPEFDYAAEQVPSS